MITRIAVVLAIAGALFFGIRDSGKEAVSGHPEALWDSGVEQVDAMISDETQSTLSDSLTDSMTYATDVGEDVGGLAE
jgi:hypothetical protein